MKHIYALFTLALLLSSQYTFGQDSCKVIPTSISKTYQGECKKGLAHGKGEATGVDSYKGHFKKGYPDGHGTYTWENGDYYIGDWKKGTQDGEGKLFTNDTVIDGLWERNQYLGLKPIMPAVKKNVGVGRYNFKRIGDGNQVVIKIFQNGMANTTITDLILTTSSGYESNIGNYLTIENVEMPLKCSIRYKTMNKFNTSQNAIIFNFEISQPGRWEVQLHN